MKRVGSFLLDTNVVIQLMRREPFLQRAVKEAERVFVPTITIGELAFGAAKSVRLTENLRAIDSFVDLYRVLPCDVEIAKVYGLVKGDLRRRGKPIPENDIWIAATAIRWDLVLVTRDAHFQYVADLKLDDWR